MMRGMDLRLWRVEKVAEGMEHNKAKQHTLPLLNNDVMVPQYVQGGVYDLTWISSWMLSFFQPPEMVLVGGKEKSGF